MTKVEISTSVTLCIQWVLHPFENPQVAEQKLTNSKWALIQTNELLEANSIKADEVKSVVQFNGEVLLEIKDPEMKRKDGNEFWEEVLFILTKSKDIESISVYVNNDTSERIAINLADRVNCLWHQGYQGWNNRTLIYHK